MRDIKILVELDCLLDTLLGTVELVEPTWVRPLLMGGYHDRNSDKLSLIHSNIDNTRIADAFANRDIFTLQQSKATLLVELLASKSVYQDDPEHPDAVNISLTVNTYPYDIPRAVTSELFKYIKSSTRVDQIRKVDMPISDVSPEYLKDRFDKVIIRDINEWWDNHAETLSDHPIPQVTMTAPFRLLKGREKEKRIPGIARSISMAFVKHLDVEMVELSDISIDIGDQMDSK